MFRLSASEVSRCFWSLVSAAAGDLTAGMPLSPGMCWSLRAAHGSPLSPET